MSVQSTERGARQTPAPSTSRAYRRLARKSLGLGERQSLWLGEDHLLAMMDYGYSEDYKRFYFRDIQAIVLRRTVVGVVLNVVYGTLTAAAASFPLIAALLGWGWVAAALLALPALAFAAALLGNLALGPTSAGAIRTAVQTEPLPCLDRWRRSLRIIESLRAPIEAVQGPLTDDDAQRLALAPPPRAAAAPAAAAEAPRLVAQILRPYRGVAHDILFCALLSEAVVNGLALLFRHLSLRLIGMATGLTVVMALIFAVARQHGTNLSRDVRRLVWIAAAYQIAAMFVWQIYATVLGATEIGAEADFGAIQHRLAEVPLSGAPGLAVLLLVHAAVCGALGVLGLRRMEACRRRAQVPPPLRAPPAVAPQLEELAPPLAELERPFPLAPPPAGDELAAGLPPPPGAAPAGPPAPPPDAPPDGARAAEPGPPHA